MPMLNGAAGHGWTQFSDWPPPGTRAVRLRFTAGHGLAPRAGAAGHDSYRVDPFDGSPTYWNHPDSEIDGWANQQFQDAQRLTYTTAPLKQDLVVAGPVEATLRAALSATDGNLVVHLEDLLPNGRATLAATGWLKASHRLGDTSLAPVVPGTIYSFHVRVWATHWRFAKGDSLRLSVTSGDLPRIMPDAPPGTVTVATGRGGSYADVPVLSGRSTLGP
jgi:putative CocE/NonD family hydrolase